MLRITKRDLLRRFSRNQEGAQALEFALVAGPFFLLLFAVIEIAYMFFVTTALEDATADAARRIRTGELQMAGTANATTLKTEICNSLSVAVACDGRLDVDVRTYSNFSTANSPSPITNGAYDNSDLKEEFGGAGDIVVARAFYRWKTFTPQLGTGLDSIGNGERLLIATQAFRNEPYSN
jgi:Flp pilus assembly protein TadG